MRKLEAAGAASLLQIDDESTDVDMSGLSNEEDNGCSEKEDYSEVEPAPSTSSKSYNTPFLSNHFYL